MPRELDIQPTTTRGPWLPGDLQAWAAKQLAVADSIVDNPGGGLLFATQTIGQVKAALQEHDRKRWAETVAELDRAEDLAVRREFAAARGILGSVRESLATG